MNASDMGLDPNDPLVGVRIANRKMSATLMLATQAEPPHLVDVQVVNDQQVGIWYTIEPFSEMNEASLQGWDVSRKRFVTFPWVKIVDIRSNSVNYTRASDQEWLARQKATNLQWDEDKQVRQSVGRFWRGKPTPVRKQRKVVF